MATAAAVTAACDTCSDSWGGGCTSDCEEGDQWACEFKCGMGDAYGCAAVACMNGDLQACSDIGSVPACDNGVREACPVACSLFDDIWGCYIEIFLDNCFSDWVGSQGYCFDLCYDFDFSEGCCQFGDLDVCNGLCGDGDQVACEKACELGDLGA